MAILVYSKYIPKEILHVRRRKGVKENYLRLKCGVEVVSDDYYKVIRPPMLEMVFREGERDYVFNMIDEAQKRFCGLFEEQKQISDASVQGFVSLIVKGEIKVHIYPDGTYKIE